MQSSWVRGFGLVGMREGRQVGRIVALQRGRSWSGDKGHEGAQGAPYGETTVSPERASQIHTPRTAHFGSLFFLETPQICLKSLIMDLAFSLQFIHSLFPNVL